MLLAVVSCWSKSQRERERKCQNGIKNVPMQGESREIHFHCLPHSHTDTHAQDVELPKCQRADGDGWPWCDRNVGNRMVIVLSGPFNCIVFIYFCSTLGLCLSVWAVAEYYSCKLMTLSLIKKPVNLNCFSVYCSVLFDPVYGFTDNYN